MAELGTRASGAMSGNGKKCADVGDEAEEALRARHELEQVAIETVHVGDYVFIDTPAQPADARCVIKKCVKTNERTARVVGWLLELTGGHHAWWPRGGRVWRRRTSVPA